MSKIRPVYQILVLTLFSFASILAAQEIPVLVNTVSNAKAMMILDDSGSMESVMEHADFDPTSSVATSTSNVIPSVIFRLESGSSSPSTSHTLRPVLIEYNYLFNNIFTSYRGSVYGNLYESTSLSNVSNMDLVKHMGCTTSGAYCFAPGDSYDYWGIHNAKLHGGSTTGSSVFSTSNLAQSGGSYVTDTNGHEYLYMDYYSNVYYSLYFNWGSYWPKFDSDGNALSYATRTFTSNGGTVVFNGKEIFLSAGLYRIEYLRWLFYAATADQLANLPGASRLEIVKEVMESLINDNPDVEFGISTLNGSRLYAGSFNGYLINHFYQGHGDATTGAYPKVRAAIGSSSSTLISSLANIAAAGGTPLANTYIETLRYFGGESDNDPYCSSCTYSSPIDSECDSHFIVMLTDGLPTSESSNYAQGAYIQDYDSDGEEGVSSNYGCSYPTCQKFLDDAAKFAYDTDFSSLDGVQNVISYAVGLGLDFDLLDDFAQNGGSTTALRADTASEISSTLQSIVSMIINTPVSGAGASLAESFGEEGRVYRPRFRADTWNGNIDMFYYDEDDDELNFQLDMGDILESRNISTHPRTIIAGYDTDHDGATSTTIDFSTTNKTQLRPELFQLFDDSTLSSSLLASPISDYANDSSAETLINFIHGTDYEDMRARDRDSDGFVEKLGDIVYSRPVEVGPRNGDYNKFSGYTQFIAGLKSEPNILVVGANDGMLHAFHATTGEELWAYIPSSQLKYLERLSRSFYNRQYRRSFVDGQISVEDVYTNGEWRTYLMFGLRKGGSTYTVLDITDRDDPSLVWEVAPESDAGESWSKPVVVPYTTATESSDPSDYDWAMVVGTGENKSTSGTNILVYDLSSSSPPSPTVLSLSSSDPAGTRTSSVVASNNDSDMGVDRLYVGNEEGDLYRIHVSGNPGSWSVQKLYSGSSSYPIVSPPAMVLADNPISSVPKYAIGLYWGTGRYDEREDITGVGATSQRIFGIFDPTNIGTDEYDYVQTNLTTSSLQNQSIGSFSATRGSDGIYRIPSGKKGFYINTATEITVTDDDFINPVGMTIYEPVNLRGALLFSTFLPNNDQCDIGGYGFFQAVNFRTGGGMMVDYHLDSSEPFFNGGLHDHDEDGDYDSADLTSGYNEGVFQAVVDAKVESVDLDSAEPYEHDGSLEKDDMRLHETNGAFLPSVSSLGEKGSPVSPSVLMGAQKVVIQSAYPVPASTTDSGGSSSSGDGGGDSGGDDDGGGSGSEDVPPPETVPINVYNLPISMLTFKESASE